MGMNRKVETEFIVNEEKRIVVCIIRATNDIPYRLQKYGLLDFMTDGKFYDFGVFNDIKKYVGIAKCLPEDKWDESYGRKLAEYKASVKRQKAVNKEIRKIKEKLIDKIFDLCEYGTLKDPHYPTEE